jgi:hypothetical protein
MCLPLRTTLIHITELGVYPIWESMCALEIKSQIYVVLRHTSDRHTSDRHISTSFIPVIEYFLFLLTY